MEPVLPRYTDQTINAIKSRLTVKDVVSSYVPVIAKSGRYWAKCPFHGGGNERTPSFAINEKDGFYHCFSCGESGDMFTFIMKMEHLTFPEAVEYLAGKAGVELEVQSGKSEKRDKGEIEALYELNQRLQGTFHYLLLSSPEGKEAREYLERRCVSSQMIERFQLGYAPKGSYWLHDFLVSKGYSDDILRKSGLFSQNSYPYSLFQDRLVFPVRNRQGRTVAFSGRDLSGRENVPKYVNSPDTPIYSKRHNFFGLYEALDALKKGESPALLVEGNFDVVSMHQAGITYAVASLGTAFTEEQAELISRYTGRVDIMFDSDEAGQKSTDKAIMILQSKGLECNIHHLTKGKDASEILEKYGEETLKNDFAPSETAFSYLVNKERVKYNIRTPRGKSDFLKAISPFLLGTRSSVERDSYISSLSVLLSVPDDTIREDLESGGGTRYSVEEEEENTAGRPDRKFNRASVSIDLYAMLFLANHRNLFRQYRQKISFGDLRDAEAEIIYMALENAMRNDITGNELFLSLISDEKARNDVATSFELDEYRNGKVSALDEAADRLALRGMEDQRAVLSNQLRSFSDSLDPEQIKEALERKAELDRDIAAMRADLFRRTRSEE